MSRLTRVHPITFEVLRNALVEATEEMAITLRRSAYSTNIKTRADFSCAFFDHRLRTVAVSLRRAQDVFGVAVDPAT
jgi:N-methylhydantoinase B/oxoprolinase/acetone carboxylase alpha subunit